MTQIKAFNTYCTECMKYVQKEVVSHVGYCESHKLDLYKLYCDNCKKFNENDRFFKGRKPIRFELIDTRLDFVKIQIDSIKKGGKND